MSVESLRLLAEVADYLERLPAVPATRHLAVRVREHLASPHARQVEAQAIEAATRRGSGPYTTAGLPVLEAELVGDELTVGIPSTLHGASREHVLQDLERRLKHGQRIGLLLRPSTDA